MLKISSRVACSFVICLFFQFNLHAQWKILNKSYPNVEVSDIALRGNRIIAVGTDFSNFNPHIIISNDDGKSWDSIQIPPNGYFFKTIEFKDNDTGFIGGYGSFSIWLRTTDGGLNWQYYNEDNGNKGITDMHFLNNKLGYACGYGAEQFFSGNVYKTIDGGNSWEPQLDPMDSLPLDGMQMVDEKYGFGWGNTFGFKTMLKTTDSGKSWHKFYTHTTIPGGTYWWDANEGILVDIIGGIYKTYDGGKKWKSILSPVSSAIQLNSVSFINNKTGFIVGTDGVILKSVDKGETWSKEVSPTGKILTKVEFHGNYAYAIGFEGLVLRSQYIAAVNQTIHPLSLNLFPNPVHDKLYFSEAVSGLVNIFDANGKSVLSKNIEEKENFIDINMLPNGLYWIVLNGMSAVKISIQ